jgi:hypothetical protein
MNKDKMVGMGFGIVASCRNIPQPLHQWDGNGEVRGADDAVIVTDGAAVTKWVPSTADSGIFESATPVGALRVGPPRGLQNTKLSLTSSVPSLAGTCVFIAVHLNAFPPWPSTAILRDTTNAMTIGWDVRFNTHYFVARGDTSLDVIHEGPKLTNWVGKMFVMGVQTDATQMKIIWDTIQPSNMPTQPIPVTKPTTQWQITGGNVNVTLFEIAMYPLLSDDDLVTVYNIMRAKWKAQ